MNDATYCTSFSNFESSKLLLDYCPSSMDIQKTSKLTFSKNNNLWIENDFFENNYFWIENRLLYSNDLHFPMKLHQMILGMAPHYEYNRTSIL